MHSGTLLLFAATVLPLVCTPGPDILFIVSQGLSSGTRAALRANEGIIAGYILHAILGALGVAALISAYPVLLGVIRWVGVSYLIYLAIRMLLSAARAGSMAAPSAEPVPARALIAKGFLTSFLNPKGLMVYLAILPSFIQPTDHSVALQVFSLAGIFISACAVVYAVIGIVVGSLGARGGFSDRRRRLVEGTAGGLLIFAASRMILS